MSDDRIEDLAREIREIKGLLIELLGKKKKPARKAIAPAPSDDSTDQSVRAFVALWNRNGRLPIANMPKPGSVRYAMIVEALASNPDLKAWEGAISELSRSAFHTGENPRGWSATIDFIVSPAHRDRWIEQARYRAARQAVERPSNHGVFCEECGAPATVGPGTRNSDLSGNNLCARCFGG